MCMKICENCSLEIKDIVGSGRFCSIKCARSFASKKCKEEKNKKISKSLTGKTRGRLEKKLTLTCKSCNVEFQSSMPFAKYCAKYPDCCIKKDESITIQKKEFTENQIAANKKRSENMKKWWTDERKEIQSKIMRNITKSNPLSYRGRNRGRVKQFIIDGIRMTGTWEVEFYRWAKEKNLDPQQCVQGFLYSFNGDRTYYPDFWIPSLDIYIEVKGFETEKDRAKWSQFPEKLMIIRKKEIDQIKRGSFTLEDFSRTTRI